MSLGESLSVVVRMGSDSLFDVIFHLEDKENVTDLCFGITVIEWSFPSVQTGTCLVYASCSSGLSSSPCRQVGPVSGRTPAVRAARLTASDRDRGGPSH